MPPRSTCSCMMLLMSNNPVSSVRTGLLANEYHAQCYDTPFNQAKGAHQHTAHVNVVCCFHDVAHQDSLSSLTVAPMIMTSMQKAPLPYIYTFRCTLSSLSLWLTKLMMSSNLIKLRRLSVSILTLVNLVACPSAG